MLTSYKWSSVAFISGQFHRECQSFYSVWRVWKLHLKLLAHHPGTDEFIAFHPELWEPWAMEVDFLGPSVHHLSHIGAWTKWLTFCRWHFQIHFLEWKWIFCLEFRWTLFSGVQLTISHLWHRWCLGDICQAIIWTSGDPDPWRHIVVLGHNELNIFLVAVCSLLETNLPTAWGLFFGYNCLFNSLSKLIIKNNRDIRALHNWLFVGGIHQSPMDYPHKGPVM